jgi:predicted alpha-1,2-mannosidase
MIKYLKIIPIVLLVSLYSCNSKSLDPVTTSSPLIEYVNPFIGTGGHGHTYPGAVAPFGMMQLSPDTRLDGWDGCSGYHYSDREIFGFSHTHLSGTGVSDYGDLLLMPTNAVLFNNGADGKPGYKSAFSHDDEIATPGYYEVHLKDTDIRAALTVKERSGIHRYDFPKGSKQIIIVDLEHRDEVLSAAIETLSKTQIQGHRHSKAWAEQQQLFFAVEFSRPYKKVTYYKSKTSGKEVKAAFEFEADEGTSMEVRVGISAVNEAGAALNLKTELANKSFQTVKEETQEAWERQLKKIVINHPDATVLTNFYTAMYHSMLAPNLYQDVDGNYRGMDLKIHKTTSFDYYTVFSLWDTYRATHPLYTLIEQEHTNDFINTFLAKYDEGGIMPIWDLSGNYTGCMIGYHAVPVIADAYLKGIQNYDTEKAFRAMLHSATRDKLGLASYKKFGYIPVEEESESVSKTLEYAYDDWTIAQMAKAMGEDREYQTYLQRAQYYKNVYDPKSQFMRGRFRNTWFAPFDPYEVNFNYTEANAWQYSFYVPQDVSGMMQLMGGKRQLEANLDKLFSAEDQTSGRHQVDITGLIGQYAHGNEPSHHMAYLYNFVNKPHKTQARVRQILQEQYTNTPDGISGNEDCGQMSAWYVFSSLGFYPVTPGANQYIIGAPLVEKATIYLESGKKFSIAAAPYSEAAKYIQQVFLNGKALQRSYLTHQEIIQGGELRFVMGTTPSEWGTAEGTEPVTAIKEHLIVPAPFIEDGDVAFKGSTKITLNCADTTATVRYRLGKGEFTVYEKPFEVSENTILTVVAEKDGWRSAAIKTALYKIDPNRSISLKNAYANQYNAGGENALIDGVLGAKDFRTGTWQGYFDTDMEAIVDLGSTKNIQQVAINFLEDQRSWIFLPTEVTCLGSKDGVTFTPLDTAIALNSAEPHEAVSIKNVYFTPSNAAVRYVKVIAKKLGTLPQWHLGYKHQGKSWLFIDEIQIRE